MPEGSLPRTPSAFLSLEPRAPHNTPWPSIYNVRPATQEPPQSARDIDIAVPLKSCLKKAAPDLPDPIFATVEPDEDLSLLDKPMDLDDVQPVVPAAEPPANSWAFMLQAQKEAKEMARLHKQQLEMVEAEVMPTERTAEDERTKPLTREATEVEDDEQLPMWTPHRPVVQGIRMGRRAGGHKSTEGPADVMQGPYAMDVNQLRRRAEAMEGLRQDWSRDPAGRSPRNSEEDLCCAPAFYPLSARHF
jgi:hypothetical protein